MQGKRLSSHLCSPDLSDAFYRFEVHVLIGRRVNKWIILIAEPTIVCLVRPAEQYEQFAYSVPSAILKTNKQNKKQGE